MQHPNYKSLIILIMSCCLFSMQARAGSDIILTTQAEVNAFALTLVDGNLIIQEAAGTSDPIVDLNPIAANTGFSSITVNGDLVLTDCPSLNSLLGLDFIGSVGGEFRVEGNSALTTPGGFPFILASAGSLRILDNIMLEALPDLSSLTTLSGPLVVQANNSLSTIDNFNALSAVTDIYITANSSLTSVSGFSSLVSANYIAFGLDQSLTSISGFTALESVTTDFIFAGLPNMMGIIGFDAVTNVGHIQVVDNPTLVAFNAFNNLESIDEFTFNFNGVLTDIGSYPSLSALTTSLTVINNASYADCCALWPLVTQADDSGAAVTISANASSCDSVDDLVTPGITLTNQTDINNFQFCGPIQGDLIIQDDNDGVDNIVDLDPIFLAGLYPPYGEVTGNVRVVNCNSLTTLYGLDGISSIGGDFIIDNNPLLDAIDEGITPTSIGGELSIRYNAALTSITDFYDLVDLGGDLDIYQNNALTQVSSFESLESVGGSLLMSYCESITAIGGFQALTTADYVLIGGCPELTSITGFSQLTSCGEDGLGIQFNDELASIPNFPMLTTSGTVRIWNNDALTDFDGFEALTETPNGGVDITGNLVLTSIPQFNALTSAGRVKIADNDALSSISGFSALVEVTGFSGTDFWIDDNQVLSEVVAFPLLTSVSDDLVVENNPQLGTCCWLSPIIAGTAGSITIQNNAPGCNSLDEIGGGGDIVIRTQAEMDALSPCGTTISSLSIEDALDGLDPVTSWNEDFSSITEVTGDVAIVNASGLADLEGLRFITTIGGDFTVIDCPVMEDMYGDLAVLETVGGSMIFENLDGLTFLGHYPNLTQIGGDFSFSDNAMHDQISGFNALTTVGTISISRNDALQQISGFSALETCSAVYITEDPILVETSGFSAIQDLNQILVTFNPMMTTLNAFGDIESIVLMDIRQCPELSFISNMNALASVGSYIQFLNTGISVMPEFNSLSSIPSLTLIENADLETIQGLPNLSQITQGLVISGHPSLEVVDFGAGEVSFTGAGLVVADNDVLSLCCWLPPYITQAENVGAVINISGNDLGCESVEAIMESINPISCGEPLTFGTLGNNCYAQFSMDIPVASDDCDIPVLTVRDAYDDVYAVTSGGSEVFFAPLGTHEFLFTSTDSQGNSTTCTQVVDVFDGESPVWNTGLSNDTVYGECGVDSQFDLAAANVPIAVDNCGGVTVSQVDVSGSVNCGMSDTFTFSYEATDEAGNVSEVRTVAVIMQDTEAPVISGIPADAVISCGDALPSIPSPTAMDQCSGDVTSSMTQAGSTGTANCEPGSTSVIYTYSWTASDGCGNTSTRDWTISVVNDFDFELGPDVYECASSSYTITTNIPEAVSYVWSTGDTGSNLTVTESGTYVLTATTDLGCCHTESIDIVFGAAPDAAATGAELDCTGAAVQISGSSLTPGATYAWSGPGGYTSTSQNPMVTAAGTYTLTVTAPGGCTETATTQVTANTDVPDVSATGGTIDCITTSVQLNGMSTTPGATYAWTGPEGFESNSANPTVDVYGVYTLTVTAPNGCVASTNAEVILDTSISKLFASAQTITCTQPAVLINTEAGDDVSSFAWTGPNGFSSSLAEPTVTAGGEYMLTITMPNGCTNSFTLSVEEDTDQPDVTATGGTIDCTSSQVTLTASSTTDAVTYSWTGPNGFTSVFQNPSVTALGQYTVTVSAANGCSIMASVMVDADADLPVATAAGGTIDCNSSSVQLMGTSSVVGSSYAWTGPGGFSSSMQNPTVSEAGNYSLTVTAPNGCTASESTEVELDTASPDLALALGAIDCSAASVSISSTSSVNGLSYAWAGPGGFSASTDEVTVTATGDYSLTVTASNGCTSTETISVTGSLAGPDASATGGTISCDETEVQLTGASSTAGATYTWSGPGGFNSGIQNPTVDEPGTYVLTVFAPNGCTETATAIVAADADLPNVSAEGGVIDCNNASATLTGSTTTAGATLEWTGPSGFTSTENSPTVDLPGQYTLTVTASGGCMISQTVEVVDDTAEPIIVIGYGEVDCSEQSVALLYDSNIGASDYSWTGPNGFSSDDISPMVSESGTYTLAFTGTNGCSTTESIEVELDFDYEADIMTTDATSSEGGTAIIMIDGGNEPFEFLWDNGQTGDMADDLEVGVHTVLVTDGLGCTQEFEFDIDLSIGLWESADQGLNFDLFPNPAVDYITVRIAEQDERIERIELIDAMGRVIQAQVWQSALQETIELSGLTKGMYIIRLYSSDRVSDQAFIKQ